jgi:lysozyme
LTGAEQKFIFGRDDYSKQEVIELLKKRGITKDEALFLLANDVTDCVKDLKTFDWFDKLDDVRAKVVIDMRFNLGPTRFRQFKRMITALSVGDYEVASWEMQDSQWYHQVGNRSKRLVRMMATGEDYEF